MQRNVHEGLASACVPPSRRSSHRSPEYRGVADSRAIPADYGKRLSDAEAALAFLAAQPGVDGERLAVGGASCGVDLAVQVAMKSGRARALALLSGATSDEGLNWLRRTELPVFSAFSGDEGGPLPGMPAALARSANRATTIRALEHAGHGVPMFRSEPRLLEDLADWIATELRQPAEQVAWPAPRARHHMVYDERTGEVLMLGGAQPATNRPRDIALWSWNGTAWRVVDTTAPVLANEAAAYDVERRRFVVHGGSAGGGELDVTWEWDGHVWQSVSASGPGSRAHHAMTYDAARNQLVMFGNSDAATANDTWAWDGRAWKMLAADGPPRRGVFGMAFDDRRGVVVLFGGYGSHNAILNDTWEWDGHRWAQVTIAAAPPPRWDMQMAYDAARQTVVLFGGRGAQGSLDDTWEYDGRSWTRLEIAGPSKRNGHGMAYDPRSRSILLFGGRSEPSYFNDMWKFDGTWTQIAMRPR